MRGLAVSALRLPGVPRRLPLPGTLGCFAQGPAAGDQQQPGGLAGHGLPRVQGDHQRLPALRALRRGLSGGHRLRRGVPRGASRPARARRDAAAVHEALLRDVVAGNGPGFALSRHQPGRSRSRLAFFPGCQLPASRPGPAKAAYEYLTGRLEGGVGLILGARGAPAAWAGRDDEECGRAGRGRAARWESAGPARRSSSPARRARAGAGRRAAGHPAAIPLGGTGRARSPCRVLADRRHVARCRRRWMPLAVHDPCAARRDEALPGGRAQPARRGRLLTTGTSHAPGASPSAAASAACRASPLRIWRRRRWSARWPPTSAPSSPPVPCAATSSPAPASPPALARRALRRSRRRRARLGPRTDVERAPGLSRALRPRDHP